MREIPKELQDNDDGESYYEPKLISIGPYHLKNEKLDPMQKLKLKYLSDLLARNKKNNVDAYMDAIKNQYDNEKQKYCGFEDLKISKKEFLKMLFLDGCFLVELLLKHNEGLLMFSGIDIDDLNHDLMLIENQVPFSVLNCIYKNTEWELQNKFSLFDLAVHYIHNEKKKSLVYKEVDNVDHLLHLLYICRSTSELKLINSDIKENINKCWRFFTTHYGFDYVFYCIICAFWISISFDLEDGKSEMGKEFLIYTISFSTVVFVLWMKIDKWSSFFLVIVVYKIISLFENRLKFNTSWWTAKDLGKTSSLVHGPTSIPSVKEITYAGVRWSGSVTSHSKPYKISFSSNTNTMKAGSMQINDNSFSEFENLLIYEQVYFIPRLDRNQIKEEFSYISSYTLYMRSMMEKVEDVKLLEKHGVFNILSSSIEAEKIRNFFHKKRSWLVLTKSQQEKIGVQFEALKKVVHKGHSKRRTRLVKEYFVSLLVVFAFFGFLIVNVFTCVSMIYAIKSYTQDKKN
ncbi:hypothetical protein ZOSMA_390G00020 [Zostera marina]|uniref:Uncharacterized protein n=1 Tax=Zostera marina TaxID=29655 RepID=A0A0K9P4G4_ZOSMR|nr:hypothetical protein ZOSMA_390G00020 [Zostera marina]